MRRKKRKVRAAVVGICEINEEILLYVTGVIMVH